MRFRLNILTLVLASIGLVSLALLHHKSTCRPALVPRHLSDLSSLLSYLHDLQRQEVDPDEARSVGRVATQLVRAIAADRDASSHPPPAQSPQPVAKTSAAAVGYDSDKAAFQALAIAGTQCHVARNTELWGDPVVWGSTHHTRSASECCAACQAHQLAAARGGLDKGPNSTTCNTWVFCGDPARCGSHFQECWLKHVPNPPPADKVGATAGNSVWTSGTVYGSDTWLQPYEQRKTLTLELGMGRVVVELLPALAPTSVRELRRLAVLLSRAGGGCDGCKLYRAETNFLVQGVIAHPGGYVGTPRRPNPPQRKVMERGLVCWAGGAGGPDFFVNLIDQAGFGDDHLCWGLIRDMMLMDTIVKLPTRPKAKPNEMTFLAQELQFNLTLS